MKWASALAKGSDLQEGLASVAESARAALDGTTPDLSLVFVAPQFRDAFDEVLPALEDRLGGGIVTGCTASGVIGAFREVESVPAVALAAAVLPDVDVRIVYTDTTDHPDPDAPPAAWQAWMGLAEDPPRHFILLADPFTAATDEVVKGLDYAFPGTTKIGGLISGGRRPRENVLFADEQLHHGGLVAIALGGNIAVDAVVAQGCRSIGLPMTVTACHHNVLLELDGTPPLRCLEALVSRLEEHDRHLLTTSLFLGIEMDALAEVVGYGDFLVRNLIGVDHEVGSLSVGDVLHEGQVVQFHVRDGQTSAEDLKMRLDQYRATGPAGDARGILLFSCLGRGEYLYGKPDHDTSLIREHLGNVPVAGFFGNGEIGPVGPTTYVHGYTSAIGVVREAATDA